MIESRRNTDAGCPWAYSANPALRIVVAECPGLASEDLELLARAVVEAALLEPRGWSLQ